MKLNKRYFKKELGVAWFKDNDDGILYVWITLVTYQFQIAIAVMRKIKKEKK